ncbi:hypothetical protein [Herbiconiux daphne]|uniref:DUF5667 domain-containing protein n=1 Tax=Herbiconiux daphne TaxID=2970914 RepID=A0ABT2H7P9_9MICO|nr:hypothetical protein [Herbiconiux daphne]MCS5735934.1 hypothetical protein [Herbiconiux daphne]
MLHPVVGNRRVVVGTALLAALLGALAGVAGCSAPAETPATVAASPVAASPAASAQPIEQVVPLDPLAEPLVQVGHSLVTGSEGFAPVEARTRLDMATAALEADVQVVQLSMAGGPAASQADPPVDEARIAADIAAVYDAVHAVRVAVVETAVQVVNVDAPDAAAAVRDELYLAIVDQQAQTAATDDTARQVLELVRKIRAAQDSQAEWVAAQAAAEEAGSQGAGGSSGGSEDSGGSGASDVRPVPIAPLPKTECHFDENMQPVCTTS